jgi:CRP-like cAMP-binding protein
MTTFAERFPALRQAPILAKLKDAHFEGLLGVMKEHRMQPGEVLFREGASGDSMAVIAEGVFRVMLAVPGGGETEVRQLTQGDVVGEMACVDPAPRSATVAALTPATVFLLNRAMMQALRAKGPAVVRAMLDGVIGQVTERIRSTNQTLERRMSHLGAPTQPIRPIRDPFPEAAVLRPSLYREPISLARVAALSTFTADELQVLADVSRHWQFPKGALLCREGEAGDSCFIVAEGEVEVHKAVDGQPKLLARVQGCLLGQLALVDPSPRSATLRAGTEVVALELSRDLFHQLLGEHSPFAMRFQESLAVTGIRQLREATHRLAQEAVPKAAPSPPPSPQRPAFEGPVLDSADRRPTAAERTPTFQRDIELRRPMPVSPRPPSPPAERPAAGRRPVASAPGSGEERAALERVRPRNEKQAMKLTLAYMQASLKEWGMSMDELDSIQVSRPDGIMTAAEKKARLNPH